MPYPLPDEGPPYTTGLRWFLVAVPDDVAFVRAAMGAYTELASYWKWGHEGRELGRRDAAETWQSAIDATLEALEMGFPDILLGHIDGVEALLQAILNRPCCGQAPYDFVPSPNEGAGGIAPVGVPEEAPDWTDTYDFITNPPISEWTDGDADDIVTATEFQNYLCRAANWYYDLLLRWLHYIKLHALLGGLVWEPINGIITLVLSRYQGLPSWATMVQEVADVLITLWPDITEEMADQMIESFQQNREDIICAIMAESTLAGIWTAVNSHIETILMTLGFGAFQQMVAWPMFALALATHGLIDLNDETGNCDCGSLPYYRRITNGMDLGDDVWQRGTAPFNFSRISFDLWSDDTLAVPYYADFTISEDSANGTRDAGGNATYRLHDEDNIVTYAHDTIYPVSFRAHGVHIVHAGTDIFTAKIQIANISAIP